MRTFVCFFISRCDRSAGPFPFAAAPRPERRQKIPRKTPRDIATFPYIYNNVSQSPLFSAAAL